MKWTGNFLFFFRKPQKQDPWAINLLSWYLICFSAEDHDWFLLDYKMILHINETFWNISLWNLHSEFVCFLSSLQTYRLYLHSEITDSSGVFTLCWCWIREHLIVSSLHCYQSSLILMYWSASWCKTSYRRFWQDETLSYLSLHYSLVLPFFMILFDPHPPFLLPTLSLFRFLFSFSSLLSPLLIFSIVWSVLKLIWILVWILELQVSPTTVTCRRSGSG